MARSGGSVVVWLGAFVLMAAYMVLMTIDAGLLVRTIVKPAGVLLAAFGAYNDGKHIGGKLAPKYGHNIAIGLVASAVGDINLELSLDVKPCFIVGLVAFLSAHVVYMVTFGVRAARLSILPFVVAAAITVVLLIPYVPGELVVPVIIYGMIIYLMAHSAWERLGSPRGTRSSQLLALAGALVFICSDTILAWNKFRSPFEGAKTAVMVTYYAAQLLIGASVRFLANAKEA